MIFKEKIREKLKAKEDVELLEKLSRAYDKSLSEGVTSMIREIISEKKNKFDEIYKKIKGTIGEE